MIERSIKQLPDGTPYSTSVCVFLTDTDGRAVTLFFNPDTLYHLFSAGIKKLTMQAEAAKPETPEQVAQSQLAKLVKVGIKGLLLSFGGRILDSIFRSKNHPKPGKSDDVLSWYTDLFTQVGIGEAMKNDVLLKGKTLHQDDTTHVIQIFELTTRPVPGVLPSGDDGQKSNG